jgi:hypothetical protein
MQNKDDADIITLARNCEDDVLETKTIVDTDESIEPMEIQLCSRKKRAMYDPH